MGFKEFLFTALVADGVIEEEENTVEDISVDFIYGETDLVEDDIVDYWEAYRKQCDDDNVEPVNDVDGWNP